MAAAGAGGAPGQGSVNVKDLLQMLLNKRQGLEMKLSDLESELSEVRLVASQLEKLDPERTCYQLQGNILVKMNNANVQPHLKEKLTNIPMLIEKLREEYKKSTDQIVEIQSQFNLSGQANAPSQVQSSGSRGVMA